MRAVSGAASCGVAIRPLPQRLRRPRVRLSVNFVGAPALLLAAYAGRSSVVGHTVSVTGVTGVRQQFGANFDAITLTYQYTWGGS